MWWDIYRFPDINVDISAFLTQYYLSFGEVKTENMFVRSKIIIAKVRNSCTLIFDQT